MSEVISFRLDPNNPREAQALAMLACQQEQGYSIRHILTEALLRFESAKTEHDVERQIAEILTAMSSLSDQLERLPRSDVQFVGPPKTQPSTLSDDFVLSVKSAARSGFALED